MLSSFSKLKIPKKYKPLVEFIESQCNIHSIQLEISKTKSVGQDIESGQCAGYFVETPPTIAIAIGNPIQQWIFILVHEFSHALQWLEQCDAWNECFTEDVDVGVICEEWLTKQLELSSSDVTKYFSLLGNFEFDADKRAVNLLKRFDIPKPTIQKYCQQSWAYTLFYRVMPYIRRWYTVGKEPYNTKSIWSKMPTNLNGKYRKITPDILQLYCKLFPELAEIL